MDYGYFKDHAYCITERKTPRHWYNYGFNDTTVSFYSQVGFGECFIQDDMGRRVTLVADRAVYIVDRATGQFHLATGLPMRESFDAYECMHSLGATTITTRRNGIKTEYTVFVPAHGDGERWLVTLTNERQTEADLGVVAYAATRTDGLYTPQGYNSTAAGCSQERNAVWSQVNSTFRTGEYYQSYGYMTSSEPIYGYDSRHNAFIGVYGSKEIPEALAEHSGCTNSESICEKVCYALENGFRLMPGQSVTVAYAISHAKTISQIPTITVAQIQAQKETVLAQRRTEIEELEIVTPDDNLNHALAFYKYAANMGSRWARVRHNGYRDIVSDTECFGVANPKLAWDRLCRILSYQYQNGYCPRTFIDGQVRPNNFADCAVWITFTAYALVMELGDLSLLDQMVSFTDGGEATVFEHLHRAVQYLYDFKGHHDLIRIWGGDWHDSMSKAGLEGKGVSVWLSIAWVRANDMFTELCRLRKLDDLAEKHVTMGKAMRERIEKYGWDGEYYLTAINDKGEPIGSHKNDEGQIWLNAQLWSVLSGLRSREELIKIMQVVDEKMETPYGTRVCYPPYTKPHNGEGTYALQPAGTLLNASPYAHPNAWKIAVEAILGRADKVEETLRKILPWDHTYGKTMGEPYILYNMYHGVEAGYRAGTPGQSWRTASHSWVLKSLTRFVLGVCPTIEGLTLTPCLPPSWKECAVRKMFRGCTYQIRYHQTGNRRVVVDGKDWPHAVLPYEKGKTIEVDFYL